MATTAECLGSYILDFHIYWSKASVKSKKQRKEENRWGLFLCLWSFPKQICFVWLLGHIFPDILLCEFEDVAAKWFFTLVIISVVKHWSFFPRSLGKFVYQIASLLVLLDNKINSCYWVVTYFIAVHIKSRSLQKSDFFFRNWAFASPVFGLYLTGAITHPRFHSMLVQNFDFFRRSQAFRIYITLAKLMRSICKLEYSFFFAQFLNIYYICGPVLISGETKMNHKYDVVPAI